MELTENKIVAGDLTQCHDRKKWALESNENITKFTEDDIEKITRNYSTLIGKGGFGEVYRGFLDDDCDVVAVKRYIRGDLREEFMEEVGIHSQINHKNVVKFIGYCIGEHTLMMVTEYIPKGNLDYTLHNSDIFIPLDIRLGIAIGCAEALSYMHLMHSSNDNLVCHGDIKPANILLDDNFTAKISDFGLSRLLSGGNTRYTRNVKGSIDYMDPIYLQKGRLTPRSDVYSFGIVLLELITRRRVKEGNFSLIETFSTKRSMLSGLIDAQLMNEGNEGVLTEIGKLATNCVTLDINNRPAMNFVLKQLLKLWKGLRGGKDTGQHSKSLAIFKRNTIKSQILAKLGHVKFLTRGEVKEITKNYSSLLCKYSSTALYKGTLEDNTLVVLRKSLNKDDWLKKCFSNEVEILSHIAHKHIIKLLACCMESDIPILVYEYATGGTLADMMCSGTETYFPLKSRLRVAVKIAEALAYLHSSATGVIVHGSLVASKILLDNNLMPKISGFALSRRLTKGNDYDTPVQAMVHQSVYQTSHQTEFIPTVKSDVCSFGVLLMLLIITRKFVPQWEKLVTEFTEHYEAEKSGRALFDKDIAAEENITALDEIGRLAIRCTNSDQNLQPTMEEVAEQLRLLRISWIQQQVRRGGCTDHSRSFRLQWNGVDMFKADPPI